MTRHAPTRSFTLKFLTLLTLLLLGCWTPAIAQETPDAEPSIYIDPTRIDFSIRVPGNNSLDDFESRAPFECVEPSLDAHIYLVLGGHYKCDTLTMSLGEKGNDTLRKFARLRIEASLLCECTLQRAYFMLVRAVYNPKTVEILKLQILSDVSILRARRDNPARVINRATSVQAGYTKGEPSSIEAGHGAKTRDRKRATSSTHSDHGH